MSESFDLPELVLELEELIGLSAALVIVERWGGTRLFVPERLTAEHRLVAAIGWEAAEQVVSIYAGDYLRVPRCAAMLRAKRNAELRARHAKGESAATLAREYAMTERNVWLILASAQPVVDDRQRRLF